MTFWDHLDELRRVLFQKSLSLVCVGGGIFHRYALFI